MPGSQKGADSLDQRFLVRQFALPDNHRGPPKSTQGFEVSHITLPVSLQLFSPELKPGFG